MTEQSTGTQDKPSTEKKKTGPKPMADQVKTLQAEVENLKACLSKMAHYTGSNRVLDEFGIDRWEVTKESMRKNRG